jgi:hypothetical protein
MSKNTRIRPMPPSIGNSKITMKPRAMQGSTMVFENDLPLQGIVKETNNYSINITLEQTITDAILTVGGEYIDLGDSFYLKYL